MFSKYDAIDELLVIFLELFTIRYHKYYSDTVISDSRKLILRFISKPITYKDFLCYLKREAVMCDCNIYCFVSNYVKYLNKFDKILKI